MRKIYALFLAMAIGFGVSLSTVSSANPGSCMRQCMAEFRACLRQNDPCSCATDLEYCTANC